MKYAFVLLFLVYGCTQQPRDNSATNASAETPSETTFDTETPSAEDATTERVIKKVKEEAVTFDLKESGEDGCACSVSAYLNDPDGTGTNIRETPKGKIIGSSTMKIAPALQ